MNCWSCGANQSEDYQGKIPFKAVCEKCLAWLHCCKNCVNYSPGMSNDCKIPGTEWVANREGLNYCEEFSLKKEIGPNKTTSPDDLKKSFDSLFNSD